MRAQRNRSSTTGLVCVALLCLSAAAGFQLISVALAQTPPAAVGRTFHIDLGSVGNGPYVVVLHTAARKDSAGLKVAAEGKQVTLAQNTNTTTSRLESLQFDAPVTDGVLDLTIEDPTDDACRSITRVDVVPANVQNPIVLTAPAGLGAGRVARISSGPLGLPDGTLITVKPNTGVIRTPDAAPNVAGHQVAVAGGVVTMVVELPPRSAAIIVDNADPAFTKVGAWTQQAGQGFRSSQSVAPAGTGAVVTTWTFNNLTPGALYQVATTWSPQTPRATNAAYAIQYDLPGGQHERLVTKVNQTLPPNDFMDQRIGWTTLATVVPATGTLSVQLSDLADGPVAADAIRVQQIGGPTGDLQIALSDAQGENRSVTLFPLNCVADELNFDLQSSPTAPDGYIPVSARNIYETGIGYGWLAPITTFDRGLWNPDLLLRGGHYGSADNVFRVQLDPRQDYQVTLRFWDTFCRDGMQVFVGNELNPAAEVVFLPRGVAMAQTISVPAARLSPSGWLDLRFHDTWSAGGGGDPFWIINAIEISRQPIIPPTASSPTAELPSPGSN